jgi:hypothetical protein
MKNSKLVSSLGSWLARLGSVRLVRISSRAEPSYNFSSVAITSRAELAREPLVSQSSHKYKPFSHQSTMVHKAGWPPSGPASQPTRPGQTHVT